MKKESTGFHSKRKKRPYVSPKATKLTLEQAKQFVAERAKGSDREGMDLLESLNQEQHRRAS